MVPTAGVAQTSASAQVSMTADAPENHSAPQMK
jgi:hypothetical protein